MTPIWLWFFLQLPWVFAPVEMPIDPGDPMRLQPVNWMKSDKKNVPSVRFDWGEKLPGKPISALAPPAIFRFDTGQKITEISYPNQKSGLPHEVIRDSFIYQNGKISEWKRESNGGIDKTFVLPDAEEQQWQIKRFSASNNSSFLQTHYQEIKLIKQDENKRIFTLGNGYQTQWAIHEQRSESKTNEVLITRSNGGLETRWHFTYVDDLLTELTEETPLHRYRYVYEYNSEGQLIKTEHWRNGERHSVAEYFRYQQKLESVLITFAHHQAMQVVNYSYR
jgi:hypothetical protein